MKHLAILIGLIFCRFAFADPQIQVHQLRPDYDVSGLKSAHVVIHPYEKNRTAAVNRQEREEAITQAGLKEAVKTWDELDRDVLYLKAQSLTFEKLILQYSKIDKGALKKFYVVARGISGIEGQR